MSLPLDNCRHLVIISPSEHFASTTHLLHPLPSRFSNKAVCHLSVEFLYYEHMIHFLVKIEDSVPKSFKDPKFCCLCNPFTAPITFTLVKVGSINHQINYQRYR